MIDLIFGDYNNANQPYLSNLVSNLKSQSFTFRKISCRKSQRNLEPDVHFIGGLTRGEKIKRLFKELIFSPKQSLKWLTTKNNLSYYKRARLLPLFSPFLFADSSIAHFVNSYTYPRYSYIVKYFNKKNIVSFRGFDIVVRPLIDDTWKLELKELFKNATCLHFVSDYLMNEAKSLGAPPEKCKVIYPGVDVSFFENSYSINKKIVSDEITIISTGRLVWQKGISYALYAVKELIESGINIRYKIVGEGADLTSLKFIIEDLGIKKNVELVGQKSPQEVKELLKRADIYLHPSVTEAISVAIMEAMAMKLPVIASNVGGIPELVEDGKSGILVEAADATAIADAVVRLINDTDYRRELGKRGRIIIEKKFSLEGEVKNWIELYTSILQK